MLFFCVMSKATFRYPLASEESHEMAQRSICIVHASLMHFTRIFAEGQDVAPWVIPLLNSQLVRLYSIRYQCHSFEQPTGKLEAWLSLELGSELYQ